jgi:hypothetical protein
MACWRGRGGVGAWLVLAACGPDPAEDPTAGSSSATETGGSTETGEIETEGDTEPTGTTTDGTTGEEIDETCEGSVVDHAQQCGADCPIVADVRVACDAHAFGDPGLRVAPGPDATWLATTSDATAWMMEIQPDGLVGAHELPDDVTRTTMSLALDPQGVPHLSAYAAWRGDLPSAVVFFAAGGPTYAPELVREGDGSGSVFDLEFDVEGRAHVWFSSDPPYGRAEAIRSVDATWAQADAPVPGDTGWQRFTVAPDGTSVAFDFALEGELYSLAALAAGVTQTIGTPYGNTYPGMSVQISPPSMPALDVEGPDYFVLKEHEDGYRVAWPIAGDSEEVRLDGTAAFAATCLLPDGNEPGLCPESCEERGTGIDDRMAAIARTSDGRVFVAWMWTELDQTLSYEETCDEEVGCYCNFTIERDDSRGELVLAELDVETLEVREVLRVTDKNPHLWGLFGDYDGSPRPFDMRSFGNDLAIGARVRDTEALSPAAIRVLRIDTTLIP